MRAGLHLAVFGVFDMMVSVKKLRVTPRNRQNNPGCDPTRMVHAHEQKENT